MQDFVKINENDNVVVAIKTIVSGEIITVEVSGQEKQITAREEIPAGHKMAICGIPKGSEIIKYGYCIGNAKEDIRAGAWIHVHNVSTTLGDLLEYSYEPVEVEDRRRPRWDDLSDPQVWCGYTPDRPPSGNSRKGEEMR